MDTYVIIEHMGSASIPYLGEPHFIILGKKEQGANFHKIIP